MDDNRNMAQALESCTRKITSGLANIAGALPVDERRDYLRVSDLIVTRVVNVITPVLAALVRLLMSDEGANIQAVVITNSETSPAICEHVLRLDNLQEIFAGVTDEDYFQIRYARYDEDLRKCTGMVYIPELRTISVQIPSHLEIDCVVKSTIQTNSKIQRS